MTHHTLWWQWRGRWVYFNVYSWPNHYHAPVCGVECHKRNVETGRSPAATYNSGHKTFRALIWRFALHRTGAASLFCQWVCEYKPIQPRVCNRAVFATVQDRRGLCGAAAVPIQPLHVSLRDWPHGRPAVYHHDHGE